MKQKSKPRFIPGTECILIARFPHNLDRILQGWDIRTPLVRGKTSSSFSFPHTTVLPGLQYSMAGVIRKPEVFFLVPSVRFFYETFSYM